MKLLGTYRVVVLANLVVVFLQFVFKLEGYPGRYVFHCHNLEHEDMAMMGNFELV